MLDNNYTCFGTAFTIDENDTYYYLLTAGHNIRYMSMFQKSSDPNIKGVVKRKTPLDLQTAKFDITLYHNGTNARFVNVVEVLGYHFNENINNTLNDIGLVRIPKTVTKDYGSPLYPLSLSDNIDDIKVNKIVWTYGMANGGWPTIYKGRIIKKPSKKINLFPPAIEGRSGSPSLNYSGKKVIGIIVTTSVMENPDGTVTRYSSGAIPAWKIKEFVKTYNSIITKDVKDE
jgi:hypothetical protein